jgi:hypothetical protein
VRSRTANDWTSRAAVSPVVVHGPAKQDFDHSVGLPALPLHDMQLDLEAGEGGVVQPGPGDGLAP